MDADLIEEFGESITYTASDGTSAQTLTAIVERTSEEERAADGRYARVFLLASMLTAEPVAGDELTIGSDAYKVFGLVLEDGDSRTLSVRAI